MPNLNSIISDVVIGDDLRITRSISNVPSGQTITKAWFTIKKNYTDLDTAALIQKVIDTTLVAGVGQITDTGASGVAQVYFDLTNVETKALDPYLSYYFDIQVLSSAGRIYTPEIGEFSTIPEVTKAII